MRRMATCSECNRTFELDKISRGVCAGCADKDRAAWNAKARADMRARLDELPDEALLTMLAAADEGASSGAIAEAQGVFPEVVERALADAGWASPADRGGVVQVGAVEPVAWPA